MLLKGRDILVYLSLKYQGDWNAIYQAIKNKELVDEVEVQKQVSGIKNDYTTIIDDDYPEVFKKIYKPPFVIFYKGNLNLINNNVIAISGTQHPNDYTIKALNKLIKDTSSKKKQINFAVNQDTYIDFLEENAYYNKKYILVLINGNVEYNSRQAGLIITEYPEGSGRSEERKVWSTRILSGVSQSLLVPEVHKKEDTLITVGYTLYHGKSIGVFSQQDDKKDATAELARDGALLVKTVDELSLLLQAAPDESARPSTPPTH